MSKNFPLKYCCLRNRIFFYTCEMERMGGGEAGSFYIDAGYTARFVD